VSAKPKAKIIRHGGFFDAKDTRLFYNECVEKEEFKIVIIQGPPGSGKGTQSKILADRFGFYHFTTSQVIKEFMRNRDDPETLKQKENYDNGLLMDPPWVLNVVKEKTLEILEENGGKKGIIYDGSPRTLYEAENLFDFLEKLVGKKNIKVIKLEVSEEELKRRLEKRLICGNSGDHVFIRSDDLEPGSPCPEGDGVLSKRDLDKKELFPTRISEYKNRTIPGLEFLKARVGVIAVNGEQSIENVQREIIKKVFNDND